MARPGQIEALNAVTAGKRTGSGPPSFVLSPHEGNTIAMRIVGASFGELPEEERLGWKRADDNTVGVGALAFGQVHTAGSTIRLLTSLEGV